MESEELNEWFASLDSIIERFGAEQTTALLAHLQMHSRAQGVVLPFSATTPYINSIHHKDQPSFPGNLELEWRIRSLIRWNAMAMVVRANRQSDGIGGHISTYASAAMLYEIGFNHFFKGKDAKGGGDQIYFQGHAAPGIYARAFLEGRLSEAQLENFRREKAKGGGLSSYPHPWLMPEFWEFPTVSMGLAPLMAIYQARFNKYLTDRGIKDATEQRVWSFLGDGETDEPEALGAITLAGREKLDNLVFVINCNLQRLDGPVRGNGKIIQELEGLFRGAGWNVIKVIWGREWDSLLDNDRQGLLAERMHSAIDGDYQKYSVSDGAYIRDHFFGTDEKLKQMVEHLSDEKLKKLRRGGHDAEKVFAAYQQAVTHKGQPTVILAKTVKGYGLGESGEGKNVSHQQKKLNEEELRDFRTRFGIPIPDETVADAPFYNPGKESPEVRYILSRRKELGGSMPERRVKTGSISKLPDDFFDEFLAGSQDRAISTTMAFVRILTKLLKDSKIGKLVVPIVPDEARTFGMEALFRQVGIYSHQGQNYEPVDADSLLYYKESQDGQILEEGITEAGSVASFIAAGTAYASHGVNTIPFFIFYSMFGMQRIGDFVWAAGDMRCKGFLVGGTAGRTTLAGEGLQHQDGQSHLLAWPLPNLLCYDPAFSYELAVIIEDGLKRMYIDREDVFYYITVGNENYKMAPMPTNAKIREGILKGLYCFERGKTSKSHAKAHLLASGSLVPEAMKAKSLLEDCGVICDIWSVTSYKTLYQNACAVDHHNKNFPLEVPQTSYISSTLNKEEGVCVFVSDYMKALPHMILPWVKQPSLGLGTDGFGRSEDRESLRKHFEVDAKNMAWAALVLLHREKKLDKTTLVGAQKKWGFVPSEQSAWCK